MKKLFAPDSYYKLTPEQKKEICNGCGPEKFKSVPDSMFNMDFTEACNIHDYMYQQPPFTAIRKKEADSIFLINMLSIVDDAMGACPKNIFKKIWYNYLKSKRRDVAYLYYYAVDMLGAPFYYSKTKEGCDGCSENS